MKQEWSTVQSLPTQLAFVVQFATGTEIAQGRLRGRVEHVGSGHATHFATLDDLLAFMAQVLTTLQATPEEIP